MHQWETFADLPVELSERIILLAARSYELDKAWLAQLTRASRAIHTLVQPILADKIVVTSSNILRVCAAPGPFASTRCLMVDDDVDLDKVLPGFLFSDSAFHSVDMFRGPMWIAYPLLKASRPSRVIITAGSGWGLSPADLALLHLSQITHIQAALPTVYNLLCSSDRPLSITHVIIAIDRFQGIPAPGSITHSFSILRMALIKLLELSRIQRLCIAVDEGQTEWSSALSAFASEHRETRLWINFVQMGDDPYTEFDDERWTGGQQPYRE